MHFSASLQGRPSCVVTFAPHISHIALRTQSEAHPEAFQSHKPTSHYSSKSFFDEHVRESEKKCLSTSDQDKTGYGKALMHYL